MENRHYLVPAQKEGIKKDIQHSVVARSVEDAEEWFVDVKNRLLDVNHWEHYSKLTSVEFRLTDAHGKNVNRRAHRGDHLRIYIPGPGPSSGDGYDWVVIEAIEYDDYPDDDHEAFAMRVRPSSDPHKHSGNGDAHFFSSDATSTFVIERTGTHLSAHYHGRNETANTDDDTSLFDKARNTGVALGAWLGLSDAQCVSLIKGLLE